MTTLIVGLVLFFVLALLALFLKGDVKAAFKIPLVSFSLDARDRTRSRSPRGERRKPAA